MIRRNVAAGFLTIVLGVMAGAASAAPENGWWWNPAESGRGVFIEIQDNFAYVGAFIYAPDGRAEWVVSQGTMTSPTSYNSRLLSFHGGQTMTGGYRPPGPAKDVGAFSIQFLDDRKALLNWPGGTMPIQRHVFDASVPAEPAMPRTGWWWNPDESGTGFSIEVQGSTLFLVGYMYDQSGNPVWYYSAGKMTSGTSYTAPVLQFANGQTVGGPYHPPGPPVAVGSLTLDFESPEEATLTLNDATKAAGSSSPKRGRMIKLKTQFRPKPTPLPYGWTGMLRFKEDATSPQSGIASWHLEASTILHWIEEEITLPGVKGYGLGSKGKWNLTGSVRLAMGETSCNASVDQQFDVAPVETMTVYSTGSYSFSIKQALLVKYAGTCTIINVTFPWTGSVEFMIDVKQEGSISGAGDKARIAGNVSHLESYAGGTNTITTYWNFFPIP